MQQFLYYGSDRPTRRQQVNASFPTNSYQIIHLSGEADKLRIAAIRSLLAQLAISASQPRLIWIEEAQALTLPAQQALLKALEEPPSDTTIVLSLPTPHLLVPTIVSRCQLVAVSTNSLPTANLGDLKLLKSGLLASNSQRLQLARELGKKRPAALSWLESSLTTLSQLMQQEQSPRSLFLLANLSELCQEAQTKLNANTNVQLTLESLFLSLPRPIH